jgi:hypothetical protein
MNENIHDFYSYHCCCDCENYWLYHHKIFNYSLQHYSGYHFLIIIFSVKPTYMIINNAFNFFILYLRIIYSFFIIVIFKLELKSDTTILYRKLYIIIIWEGFF